MTLDCWARRSLTALVAMSLFTVSGCGKTDSTGFAAEEPTPMLSGKLFVNKKGELSPELRSLVKRGPEYRNLADDPQVLFDRLEGSMSDRRQTAWRIVEQMVSPQTFTVEGTDYKIPLWHTWYEGASQNPEFYNKIELFYAKFEACKEAAETGDCAKSYEQLAAETMDDVGGTADPKNLASSLTDANLSQELTQLADPAKNGVGGHLGTGFTLFSPSFVEHVLTQSKGVMNCERDHAKQTGPATAPPSATQFSPCIKEFPRSAVMVKAQWRPLSALPVHDTSAAGMKALFSQPKWPPAKTLPADPNKIYAVETVEGTKWGLQSIHFSTKDTREWLWITLWWDPHPNTDFGQDRPLSIKGVWSNYKMCVTSSFNEGDAAPWKSFDASAPLLSASLRANHDALVAENGGATADPKRLTTWCSNPNVETHPENHKTNCIGCHQYAGSWNAATGALTEFNETYEPGDKNFPQQGRDRHRRTFLSDFSWGLALYEGIPDLIRSARADHKISEKE